MTSNTQSTELVVASAVDHSALASILGQADPSEGHMPRLKVNYQDADEDERGLKKGTFFLTDQDTTHYATNVSITPICQTFQYRTYDADVEKTTCRTLMLPRFFGAEFRDTNGTIRCGKPSGKEFKALDPEEQKQYSGTKCYRQIYCLVSYTGKEPDTRDEDDNVLTKGESFTYENVLAVFEQKGASFNAFEDEYEKTLKRGEPLYNYAVTVKTKRQTKGSVTYFVTTFKADKTKNAMLPGNISEQLTGLASIIAEQNSFIDSKYEAAFRENQLDNGAINALDGPGSQLEADMADNVVDAEIVEDVAA